MPVWFAYRCLDFGPTGKYLRRFEDDTVLGWFRRHWGDLCVADFEEADRRLAGVLGCDGWYLPRVFTRATEAGRPAPEDGAEVLEAIRAGFPGGDIVSTSPHCIQFLNEDDGEGGPNFFFDGHFLAESPGLASYLLHEDWRLPPGHPGRPFTPGVPTIPIEPGGSGPGATYLAMLIRESKHPIADLPVGYRIDGVRLPGLAAHLCQGPREGWHGELHALPALMLAGARTPDPMEGAILRAIQDAPSDPVNWAAWSDWRQDHGREPPGISLLRDAFARIARLPGQAQNELPYGTALEAASADLLRLEGRTTPRPSPQSLIHVEEHLAQMCLDVSWDDTPYYDQWIFFDDLWAGAHKDLADAILCFAARWDVLSID